MKNFKLVKTAAAVALGASVVTAAVVPGSTNASAASKYKVSNGNLVNAKTGKVVKGYVVYNSKLYYNGKLKKGYKTVGSGKTIKLYYNGSLKKGYKTARDSKLLFYNGSLKKGYKTAGNGERLYKDGHLDKGYEVYGDVDQDPSLYYNGYLKSGYKTANNATLLFYNGKLKEGYKTAKNGTVLYKDGRLNKGFVKVEDKFYNDAELANGTFEYEGKEVAVEKGVEVGAKVKEVKAINGSTLEITFNKAVDKEDAEKAVVTLGGDSLNTGKLSEDGHVLTIEDSKINDKENATLEVPAIQTKEDAKVSTPKYVTVFSYKDTVAPELVSATASAKETTKDIVVTFNEKLKDANVIAYVNGVAAQAKVVDNTVQVTAPTALKAGETATVKLVNVQDVAGNYTSSNPFETTFTVVADNVAPVATDIKVVGEDTVQVTFDKEVTASSTLVPYLSSNGLSKAVFSAGVVDSKNKKVVTYKLPDTTAFDKDGKLAGTFYLPAEAVTDKAGNVSAASNSAVSFEIDKVKPTVTSVEFTKENKVVLEFSKELSAVDGTKVSFKNPVTGSIVTVAGLEAKVSNADAKKVELTGTFVDGSYELVLQDGFATDKASSKNTSSALTTKVEVKNSTVSPAEDKTAPEVTLADDINFNENVLAFRVVDTDSSLDFASIRNVNNYTVAGKPLPAGTTITTDATDAKAKEANVTITVPAGSVAKTITGKFAVSGIKDIAGNSIAGIKTSKENVTLTDNIAPTIANAKIYSDKTIVISFSEAVDNAGKDVVVKVNGQDKPVDLTVGIGGNAGKLVGTIADLEETDKVEVSYKKDTDTTKDSAGNAVKAFDTITATR